MIIPHEKTDANLAQLIDDAGHSSIADYLVASLVQLKVKYAFGVSGGNIAPIWEALEYSAIETLHFRHENGAIFAACEYSIVTGEPVAVFVTGGPGIANGINALVAARWEGAKIIFLSPFTDLKNRGRFAFQETTARMLPRELILSDAIFNFGEVIESPIQLSRTLSQALNLFQQPGGCLVSLCIPQDVQKLPIADSPWQGIPISALPICDEATIRACAEKLSGKRVVLWLGFGARGASDRVRELAEKIGAAVMSTPRGKGIFPEDHPQYLGVTGFGGHDQVFDRLEAYAPEGVLVLGSKLGEFTSFWDERYLGGGELIHVDLDMEVFGRGYPGRHHWGIVSEIASFLEQVLPHLEAQNPPAFPPVSNEYAKGTGERLCPGKVMEEIQNMFIRENKASLISEAGNSFAWATHTLSFTRPGYRVSTGYGSMGHAVSGVIGMALVDPVRKAIALVGDGAMLMSGTEINTAVKYNIPAIWIVLNDGYYNMCRQGNALQKMKDVDCGIPQVDFANLAQSLGAEGMTAIDEPSLREAFQKALHSQRPTLIDVRIDPEVVPPFGQRIAKLAKQDPG